MLRREPKVTKFRWSQVFKGVLYVEAVIFLGSFYFYRKLVHNQEYRHKYYQKHGFILEVGYDYRTVDYKKWNIPLENKKNN